MERILEITNPMLLLAGIIFIIVGAIMYQFPPKKINSLYGYRTAQSMKNQKNWDFAQVYGSKALGVFGLILLIISFTRTFFSFNNDQHALFGLFILIVGIAIMFYFCEKAIKNNEIKPQ